MVTLGISSSASFYTHLVYGTESPFLLTEFVYVRIHK